MSFQDINTFHQSFFASGDGKLSTYGPHENSTFLSSLIVNQTMESTNCRKLFMVLLSILLQSLEPNSPLGYVWFAEESLRKESERIERLRKE
jgi:hypothetical protein